MALMPAASAWSYSGDPSDSPKDTVRFWLQDTDPDLRLLADVDIEYLISKWMPKHDSLIYVAAKAAELISTKFAGVLSVSADGVTVNTADLQARYVAVADRLETVHKDFQIGGEIDLANLMAGTQVDPSIEPLNFGIGVHDNLEAGRQGYGGARLDPWKQAWDYVHA